ncbi:MAG: alpha/beta fold hydrolase [Planctomycetaceae bacterium]|nr:alpha/beta fold hydrolase [Planctomycetaceae bacterium]
MRSWCGIAFFVVSFAGWCQVGAAEPTAGFHQQPSLFVDDAGEAKPVTSRDEWQLRRADILRQMQTVMGPLPDRTTFPPANLKVLETTTLDGGLERRKVEYSTDSPDRKVRAWLFLPGGEAKQRPAVLCLHQTIGIGKDEPAGLGGSPNLHYAIELAQRGFVTLAPDYPSFGEYQYEFPAEHGYISGSMKAIADNLRAVDVLQSLPQVDPKRIGCIGHSLGGHNTMFTAAFDERIKAMVSSCGFTRFHKYYEGKLAGWTSARYMPRIASVHHNNPDEMPFDFPEIVAVFAPRPFLACSPLHDGNFEVSGVRDTLAAARPIYDLYGSTDKLQALYPDCGHDFPPEIREAAYRFLAKSLSETK